MPLTLVKKNADVVVDCKVTRFPAVPDTLNASHVCVVPAVNSMVDGLVDTVMFAKRLLPVIVNLPEPP